MPKKMTPRQKDTIKIAKEIREKSVTGVCKVKSYGKTYQQALSEASAITTVRAGNGAYGEKAKKAVEKSQSKPKRKTTTKKK